MNSCCALFLICTVSVLSALAANPGDSPDPAKRASALDEYDRAVQAFQQQRKNEAADLLLNSYRDLPDRTTAFFLCEVYSDVGNYAGAKEFAQRALDWRPPLSERDKTQANTILAFANNQIAGGTYEESIHGKPDGLSGVKAPSKPSPAPPPKPTTYPPADTLVLPSPQHSDRAPTVTGFWEISNKSSYYINQRSNTVYLHMRSALRTNEFQNVFQGTRVGSFICGTCRSSPFGNSKTPHPLTLQVISVNKIIATEESEGKLSRYVLTPQP
jgi:hypothetical protein